MKFLKEKNGTDSELHKKIDAILAKLEKQDELERKINNLNVAVQKVSEDVKRLIDVVEKNEKYAERFVNDVDNINDTLRVLEDGFSLKFQELLQISRDSSRKNADILDDFHENEVKIEKVETSMERLDKELIHSPCDGEQVRLEQKLLKFEQELKETVGAVSKGLKNKETWKPKPDLKPKPANLNVFEVKVDRILSQECYKCATVFLPKNLLLRDDGCSVECPTCKFINPVGALKEGKKWMFIGECGHYQQFSSAKKEGERELCQVCGKRGKLTDGNKLNK